jgi:hypothetical protein
MNDDTDQNSTQTDAVDACVFLRKRGASFGDILT